MTRRGPRGRRSWRGGWRGEGGASSCDGNRGSGVPASRVDEIAPLPGGAARSRDGSDSAALAGLAARRDAEALGLRLLAIADRVGELLADEAGRRDRDRDLRPDRDLLLPERLEQAQPRLGCRALERLALVRAGLLLLLLLLGLALDDD